MVMDRGRYMLMFLILFPIHDWVDSTSNVVDDANDDGGSGAAAGT
jgi:hypothetical protein